MDRLWVWSVRTWQRRPRLRASAAMRSIGLVAVRPVAVGVAVAAQVSRATSVGQLARERGLDLAAVLAQRGLDEGQAEELVDLRLGGEGPHLGALLSSIAVSRGAKPCSDRLQPRSRAIARSRTLCSAEPVKWTRYVPALPSGMVMTSTCGPRSSWTVVRVAAARGAVAADPLDPRRRRAACSMAAAGSSVSTSRSMSRHRLAPAAV